MKLTEYIKQCRINRKDFDDFVILTEKEEITTREKIRVKHLKCGTVFDIYSYNFRVAGMGCRHCANQRQKKLGFECGKSNTNSHEEFLVKFNKVSGNMYTLLSRYLNSKTKIKVRCNTCGRIYEVLPTTFLKGSKCRHCSSENRKARTVCKRML